MRPTEGDYLHIMDGTQVVNATQANKMMFRHSELYRAGRPGKKSRMELKFVTYVAPMAPLGPGWMSNKQARRSSSKPSQEPPARLSEITRSRQYRRQLKQRGEWAYGRPGSGW